jgi:hypothetical protein
LLPIFGFQKKKQRNIYIQKKSKRRHSIEAIFTVFLNITAVALKAGDVGSDRGTVFNQEARLATDVPRHRDARDCYQNNACVLWLQKLEEEPNTEGGQEREGREKHEGDIVGEREKKTERVEK